jgi:hypothetical protein
MTAHKPARIYFPVGISSALAGIAAETGYNEQYSALTLWQFQRRLTRNIIDRKGKISEEHRIVPMNATILRRIVRDSAGAVRHMDALIRHGVLERRAPHLATVTSRLYSYTGRFDPLGKQERYMLHKPTVLNAFYRSKRKPPDDPYFRARQEYLYAFDLDAEGALRWACTEAPKRAEDSDLWLHDVMHTMDMILSGNRTLLKDSYGREHHPFLWLPRHIRKTFVTYRGQQLVQLDLPAAQPLLLYAELKKRTDNPELQKFRHALQQDFYLYIADAWQKFYGGPTPTRDEMKNGPLYIFFFGQVIRQIPIFPVFESVFPDLYRVLAATKKRNGYKSIAAMLQEVESRIVFSVCQKLTEQNLIPFFSVHDCLAVLPEHADRTEQIFLSHLSKEGIDWLTTLRKE